MTRLLPCTLLVASILAPPSRAAEPFELRQGDRVVLVGSTLIEREQRYGYWETALTARYPDRDITFRNLGWSGDTVFGHARAGFGSVADGFRHLKDHVLALKPTVIILGYGTNESFEGPAGLPKFKKGLNTLLDTLAPSKARFVLLSPLRQENLAPPLPDPTEQNRNLRLYADAIREVAKKRGCTFVDLYSLLDGVKHFTPLTDNGLHLTAWGYWFSADALESGLGLPNAFRLAEINTRGEVKKSKNVRIDKIATQPLRFRATLRTLPLPHQPSEGAPLTLHPQGLVIQVKGLSERNYTLRVDGKAVVTAPQAFWTGRGVFLPRGPDMEQAERLRRAIVAKNRLYFHRWRPQNETYLFGFRKHEQGQNAREIPQFDPLIAAREKEIAQLRKPKPHLYELTPERKGDK